MNKEELAKRYADKKVEERKEYILYDLHRRKTLTTFDGYAIEEAYEDGFDKAMELTCEFLYEQLNNGTMECGNIEEFIKNYKKKMEGKK